MRRLFVLFIIACAMIVFCVQGYCAQVVNGTMLSNQSQNGVIKVKTDKDALVIKSNDQTKVTRGLIGSKVENVTLSEIVAGDRIISNVKADGTAISIKAYFGMIRGTIIKVDKGSIYLKDGRSFKLSPAAKIVMPDDKSGKLIDIKPKSPIVARINPSTKEVWTLVVSKPVVIKSTGSKATLLPAKITLPKVNVTPKTAGTKNPTAKLALDNKSVPKISSLTLSAPIPLSPGDAVVVKLIGTPSGNAVFEITNLVPKTPMKEVTSGVYQAMARIPRDKSISNAALLGYLTINGQKAPAMQAAKLITVIADSKGAETKIVPPAPVAAPVPPIEPPKPVEPPAPIVPPAPVEPPKPPEIKNITIISPADGDKVREIFVRGIAEPDSKILVEVTYSNTRMGVLDISGNMVSQLIAANKDGEFSFGAIPLEGKWASSGLIFVIKAYYPENSDKEPVILTVTRKRN